MDLDLLDINEAEVRHVNYKQTCKRKSRLNDEGVPAPPMRTVRQRPGLEESSAPDNYMSHQEEEEETKNADASTLPVF